MINCPNDVKKKLTKEKNVKKNPGGRANLHLKI